MGPLPKKYFVLKCLFCITFEYIYGFLNYLTVFKKKALLIIKFYCVVYYVVLLSFGATSALSIRCFPTTFCTKYTNIISFFDWAVLWGSGEQSHLTGSNPSEFACSPRACGFPAGSPVSSQTCFIGLLMIPNSP